MLALNLDASNGFNLAPYDQFACSPTPASMASFPSAALNGMIAFTRRDAAAGNAQRVFVMNGDGANVRQITLADATGAEDLFPAISPDGTKVAFVSKRALLNSVQFQEVFVVNTDGTGLRQVTNVSTDATGNSNDGIRSVAWNSTSSKLAFKGFRFSNICNPSTIAQHYDLVGTINLDGTGETHLACVNSPRSVENSALDWSPDGSLIAFGMTADTGGPAVAIIDPAGTPRFSLTLGQLGTACGGPHCMHFSPDSTRLAYQSAGTFNGISIINLDGTGRSDSANLGGFSPDNFWWAPGPPIPAAAQLTLGPDPVLVWPRHTEQLVPTLLDASNNVITHAAQGYCVASPACAAVDPLGRVSWVNTNTTTLNVMNAGLTSNTVLVNCLASSPCTPSSFSINPTSQNFPAAGGSNSVAVTALSGCNWTAASNAAWISITSGASGAGNGTVNYSVAANTTPARAGTMTIAGNTFTVNQATGCQTDVSGQVTLKLQNIHFDKKDNVFNQKVVMMNNGAALTNVRLALNSLSPGVTLANANGVTSCTSTGSPFVTVGSLAADATKNITLMFNAPAGTSITYTPGVLAGAGTP